MNCSKRDCPFEAQWYPVFLIYPDRRLYPDVPGVRSMAGVALCSACKGSITPEDLLTESGWELIEAVFRMMSRGLEAHRPSTGMEFILCSSYEGQLLMRKGPV